MGSPPPSPPWSAVYGVHINASVDHHGLYNVMPRLADSTIVLQKSLEMVVHNSPCEVAQHARTVRRDCDGKRLDNASSIPLLVTTMGRSGTTFLQTLLHKLGLTAMHDNLYGTGTSLATTRRWPPHVDAVVSWPQAFEDTTDCQIPLFGVQPDRRRFLHLAHLVRDPLVAIGSRFNLGSIEAFKGASACFTAAGSANATGKGRAEAALQHTLRHYVFWNSFVEATSRFHLPLERIDATTLRSLLAYGGLRLAATDAEIGSNISKLQAASVNSAHTKKAAPLTWARLGAVDREFATLAQLVALRHGYRLEQTELLWDPPNERRSSTAPGSPSPRTPASRGGTAGCETRDGRDRERGRCILWHAGYPAPPSSPPSSSAATSASARSRRLEATARGAGGAQARLALVADGETACPCTPTRA